MVKRTQLQAIPSFTEASNIRYYLKITHNGKENNGKQIYDNSDGSYLPDRKVNPLVFQPVIRLEDPNILTSDGNAAIGNARITSVRWYTSDGKYDTSGKPILTEIPKDVTGKTEITENTNTGVFQLKYYLNTHPSESGRKICCKVNYTDPNSSSSQSIMMEETLTTTVSASISLSLGSEPDLSSTSKLYVCDGYELNPMSCPRVDRMGTSLKTRGNAICAASFATARWR